MIERTHYSALGGGGHMQIVLVPSGRMFFIENFGLLVVYLAAVLCTGASRHDVALGAMALALLLTPLLLYRWWYLVRTRWTVTEKQLKSETGVFSRDVQYIELYRVVDYCEKQSFLHMLLGLKDVIIFSGDRTTPAHRIYGIPVGYEIIAPLKDLVEHQKRLHHVYEITNR